MVTKRLDFYEFEHGGEQVWIGSILLDKSGKLSVNGVNDTMTEWLSEIVKHPSRFRPKVKPTDGERYLEALAFDYGLGSRMVVSLSDGDGPN